MHSSFFQIDKGLVSLWRLRYRLPHAAHVTCKTLLWADESWPVIKHVLRGKLPGVWLSMQLAKSKYQRQCTHRRQEKEVRAHVRMRPEGTLILCTLPSLTLICLPIAHSLVEAPVALHGDLQSRQDLVPSAITIRLSEMMNGAIFWTRQDWLLAAAWAQGGVTAWHGVLSVPTYDLAMFQMLVNHSECSC